MKKFNKDGNSGGRDLKRFNKYDDFKDNSRGRNSGKFSGGGRSSSGRNSSNSYSETQMHPDDHLFGWTQKKRIDQSQNNGY